MSNIWERIKNEVGNIKTPKDIIQEQCDKLSEITDGKVIARITEYEGEYQSVTVIKNAFSSMINSSSFVSKPTVETKFNVQSELGDNVKFVYEFYITSKNTPKYKYRVFFLYFSALLYPVGISLVKSISDEIGREYSEFEIKDEGEFIETIDKVLSTERIFAVIKNLYSMN